MSVLVLLKDMDWRNEVLMLVGNERECHSARLLLIQLNAMTSHIMYCIIIASVIFRPQSARESLQISMIGLVRDVAHLWREYDSWNSGYPLWLASSIYN